MSDFICSCGHKTSSMQDMMDHFSKSSCITFSYSGRRISVSPVKQQVVHQNDIPSVSFPLQNVFPTSKVIDCSLESSFEDEIEGLDKDHARERYDALEKDMIIRTIMGS